MNECQKFQHKPYFLTIPAPIDSSRYSQLKNQERSEVTNLFNEILRTECQKLKVEYIDIYKWTLVNSLRSDGLFHCDGIHLNTRVFSYVKRRLTQG